MPTQHTRIFHFCFLFLLFLMSPAVLADTFTVPSLDNDGNYEIVLSVTPRSGPGGAYFYFYELQGSNWVELTHAGADEQVHRYTYKNKPEGIHKYKQTLCSVSVVSGTRGQVSTTCNDNERSVLVEFIPPAPTLTVPATNSNGLYTVSWTAVPLVSTYELYENDIKISTSTSTKFTFAESSRRTDGTYQYKVKACKTKTCSAFSTPASVTVRLATGVAPGGSSVDPSSDTPSGAEYSGALSGIESVGNDGSFAYSVPIALPPGINGVQPKLALHYNSNSKNSLLGWGWSLAGLSAISRCPAGMYRDGYLSGINSGDRFKFCLDGMRLVEIAADEYRTESETFMRIRQSGNYWLVTHPDGAVSRYGFNADSRLEDSSDNARSWFLDEYKDVFDNAYRISYSKDSAAGTHYPSRIDYTSNPLLPAQHSVVFRYEARSDGVKNYVAGKLSGYDKRVKAIDIISAGNVIKSYGLNYQELGIVYHGKLFDDPAGKSRIAEITLCFADGSHCAEPLSFDWNLQSKENFKFVVLDEPYEKLPLMIGNNKLALDINGDGKMDVYSVDDTAERILHEMFGLREKLYRPKYIRADVNGDKYDDVIKINSDDSLVVFLSNGKTINPAPTSAFSIPRSSLIFRSAYHWQRIIASPNNPSVSKPETDMPYELVFADANGDGYVDVIRYPQCGTDTIGCNLEQSPKDISVALNNQGKGFLAFAQWYGNWTGSMLRLTFTDLNGDGAVDFFATNQVHLNRVHGVLVGISDGKNAFSVGGGGLPGFPVGAKFGDFNGDGIKDYVKYNLNESGNPIDGLRIQLGHGRQRAGGKFADNFLPESRVLFDESVTGECTSRRGCELHVADVNQDGLDDLIWLRNAASTDCVDEGGFYQDEVGLYHCQNLLYTLWGQTESVFLSKGTDTNGSVRFSKRATMRDSALAKAIGLEGWITFNFLNEVNGSAWKLSSEKVIEYGNRYPRTPTSPFDDYNGDGTIEDDPRITSRVRPNRIEKIFEQGREIKIDYKSLGSGDAIYDVESGFGLVEPSGKLRKRFAVKTVSVSNSNGGYNTSSFQYSSLVKNPFDLGDLGFSKITRRDTVEGESPIRIESYFYQNIGTDYRLSGQLKRQVVVAEISSGAKALSDSRYQWRIRKYNDDIDTDKKSPHYFPYLYRSSTSSWDLYGVVSFTKTQNTESAEPRCSALAKTPSILSTQEDVDFHPDGVLYYTETSKCDLTGEADSVQVHARKNSSIVRKGRAIGLVQQTQHYSWTGSDVNAVDLSAFDPRTTSYTFNSLGRLASSVREPTANGSDLYLSTALLYNGYGSIKKISESWSDLANDGLSVNERHTTITETYSDAGRQVIVKDAKGLTETTTYHPVWGTPTVITDANSLTTTTRYDVLGRPIEVIYPDTTHTAFDYRVCTGCDGVTRAEWYQQSKATGASAARVYMDAQNREIATRTRGLDGSYVYTHQTFNNRGQVFERSEPYYQSEQPNLIMHHYDTIGRVERVEYPDNTDEEFIYQGLSRTTINRVGQEQVQRHNASGWVIRSTDDAGIPVDFTYWPSGALRTSIVNNNSKTLIEVHYDRLGRKTRLADPNAGVTTYSYNALNLVATQVDAKQQRTCMAYDLLGRLTGRVDLASATCTGTYSHSWTYDTKPTGRGALATLTGRNTNNTAYREDYTYTTYGLPDSVTRSFEGRSFVTRQLYDQFNRPAGITYPSGYTITNVYNNYGHLSAMRDSSNTRVWRADGAKADGRLTGFTLGNGVVTTQTYHPTMNYLEAVRAIKGSLIVQDHRYAFDGVGNLKSRTDQYHDVTQSFCYDNLNRLTSAGFSRCDDGSKVFGYDELGNLRSKKEDGISMTLAYTGQGQSVNKAGPHAVTAANGWNYVYDAAGNITESTKTSQSPRRVTYSPFSTPIRIAQGTKFSEFVYGPNQDRIKHSDSNGRTTLYVGGHYEEVTLKGVTRKIHYVGDFLQFVQESGVTPTNRYEYLHRDHLGSIVAVSEGVVNGESNIDRYSNGVWGERRFLQWNGPKDNALIPNTSARGFTDHEHLDAVGLVHMNGRVYDPELGRFLSADPLILAPNNSQSYNRYSYVWNNPLSLTDPSGYAPVRGQDQCNNQNAGNNHGPGGACSGDQNQDPNPQPQIREEVTVYATQDGLTLDQRQMVSYMIAAQNYYMDAMNSAHHGVAGGGSLGGWGSITGSAQKGPHDKLRDEYERALQKIEDIKENVAELATDASIRVGVGAAEIRLGFSDGRPAFDIRAAFNKWSFHAKGWSVDLDTNWFTNDVAGDGGRLWLGAFAQARGALGPFRASAGGEGAMFLSNGNLSGYTNDQLFNYDAGLRLSRSYSVGVGWRLGGVASEPLF